MPTGRFDKRNEKFYYWFTLSKSKPIIFLFISHDDNRVPIYLADSAKKRAKPTNLYFLWG